MKALLATAATLAALATLTGCSGGSPAASTATAPATTTATTTATVAPSQTVEAAATEAVTGTTSTTTVTSAPTRTAAAQGNASADLAAFVRAARAADAALDAADKAVQSDIDTNAKAVRPATRATLKQADAAVNATERAIPTGLDAALLRPALRLFSELDARRAGFQSADDMIVERGMVSWRILEAIQGYAATFPADVTRVEDAAIAHRPVPAQPATSLSAAEVSVRTSFLTIGNVCRQTWYPVVVTDFPKLVWTNRTASRLEGKLGGGSFTLELQNGRWAMTVGPDC